MADFDQLYIAPLAGSENQSKNPLQSDILGKSDLIGKTEREGRGVIHNGVEFINKIEMSKLSDAIRTAFEKIDKDYGYGNPLYQLQFTNGLVETMKRNGANIGVIISRIKENPQLVYDIVSRRVKEYAIKCSDDPVKCATDLHGKTVDYVWQFIQKSEKENYKNFSFDMGQATGEALLGMGTLGTIYPFRLAHLNPELKDPKDYPTYMSEKIKPQLDRYLSSEGRGQLDLFIQKLAKEIGNVDLIKLDEFFGKLEQFAKDREKGVVSSPTTMVTLTRFLLDATYDNLSEFDGRPLLKDLTNIVTHKNTQEHGRETTLNMGAINSFKFALKNFSTDHQGPLLKTYFELQNQKGAMPKRETLEPALNELIIFRYEYCKDLSDGEFKDMMAYVKDQANDPQLGNPRVRALLKLES